MIGTYSVVNEDGEASPAVRVTREGNKLSIFLFDGSKNEWVNSADWVQLLTSSELKSADDSVRRVPFPDSMKDLPDGTLCAFVDKIDRVDDGYGSYAFFYIPANFNFGNFGRSEQLPAGYYLVSSVGQLLYLNKVR